MKNAILINELIAIQAGNVIVYNMMFETREYISESTEYFVGLWYSGMFLFRCAGS